MFGGTYGEEFGRIGKPGFDEGGKVEDEGAGEAGGEERGVVGDVAVEDFDVRRKGGDIAGGSYENPDRVTLPDEGFAEFSTEETGCAGHQYLHCFLSLCFFPCYTIRR